MAVIGQYLKTHFQSLVPFLSGCEGKNTEKLLGGIIKKSKIKTINTKSLLTLTYEKNLPPSLILLLFPPSLSLFLSFLTSLPHHNKQVKAWLVGTHCLEV